MIVRDYDGPAVPIAPTISQSTPCPGCGYDLKGLRLDGRCPECGRPTIDTFGRPLGSTNGHVLAELLGIAGRGLVWLIVATLMAAVVRRAGPLAMGVILLPPGVLAAGVWLACVGRLVLRGRHVLAVANRFALADPVEAAWRPWAVGAGVSVLAAAAALLGAGDVVFGSAGLAVAFLCLGAAATWVAAATQQLVHQSALPDVSAGATAGVAAAFLLAAAATLVPMPFLGQWEGLLARLAGATLAVAVYFVSFLHLNERLRRGQGPVSSL